MNGGDHAHGAHEHDGPTGGAGWVVLDAIVTACAAAILCTLLDWWLRDRRARAARAAYADMRPAGEGQAEPDPGSVTGAGG